MANFLEFYQNGGIFMHFITVGATVALTAVMLHGRARRMGADDTKLLRVGDRVAWLCVAMGVLGSVFGMIELGAAVSMIDPETIDAVGLMQAAARGGSIVPITLGWALMCAIPIWFATIVQRARGPVPARPGSEAG